MNISIVGFYCTLVDHRSHIVIKDWSPHSPVRFCSQSVQVSFSENQSKRCWRSFLCSLLYSATVIMASNSDHRNHFQHHRDEELYKEDFIRNVPPACSQHNAVHTLLHFLTDITFLGDKVAHHHHQ